MRLAKKTNVNKTTRKVVKQMQNLAAREQALTARLNRMSVRRRNRRPNTQRQNGNSQITSTVIPTEIAYRVKQPSGTKTHVEKSCEYIGSFVMAPTSKSGDSMKFLMNPVTLFNTRLCNLANNYQKYRFKKLALTVQSTTTTGTSGLYIVGYNSNPDAEYTKGSAIASVFDLPGAQSSNIWLTTKSEAKIEDKQKWYNIDEDSQEIMSTTQGYFALVIQSPPTTTGEVVMPVLLDYEIEFSGRSYAEPATSFDWPAGTYEYNSITKNYTFVPQPGETPGPVLPVGGAYTLNPEYPVDVFGTPDNIGVLQGTTASWQYFRNIEDFNNNVQLQPNATFTVGRTKLSPVVKV